MLAIKAAMQWKQYTTLSNHSQQFIEISFPPVEHASAFFKYDAAIVWNPRNRYFSYKNCYRKMGEIGIWQQNTNPWKCNLNGV